MKLAKSLLLGSAAAFVATTGYAADLPSTKAAPVTYVKVCDIYGAGFFYIPGTDTCLKVGGRVRADYSMAGKQDVYTAAAGTVAILAGAQNASGNEARGRLDMDARTGTGYGTVQTVSSFRVHRTSGNLTASTSSTGAGTAAPQLEAAYMRFAGFTFGVAKDNFAFMPSRFYGAGHWGSFANGAMQIAYTAVLGGGFSATIALQDKSYTSAGATITGGTGTLDASYDRLPQVNGRLDFEQSFGSLSLAGAVGQNHTVTSATSTAYDKSKMAYAISGSAKINLPMLAAGDAIWLTTAYADGMTEYTTNWTSFKSSDQARVVGGRVQNHVSYFTGTTGIENFKSWNVAAVMDHYWAPQWRQSFLATYGSINAPATLNARAWGVTGGGFADAKVWNVGSQIAFLPTKDFEIGIEALYARVQNSNSTTAAANVSQGNWTGRMRVERTF